MAATIEEKPDSRRWNTEGSVQTLEYDYIVRGTSDDVLARSMVEAEAPLLREGLTRKAIRMEADWADETNDDGLWQAIVRWDSTLSTLVDASSFSFDISGGTHHITHSRLTRATFPAPGKVAPNCHNAIGDHGDGNIEGVDVFDPVFNFTETHFKSYDDVTTWYVYNLATIVGKVNSTYFKGFRKAEALFLGATGARREAEKWEITYRFAISYYESGIEVGPITGIWKLGWDYLWVRWEPAADTEARGMVTVPVAAYVEQVYKAADFSALGIGIY